MTDGRALTQLESDKMQEEAVGRAFRIFIDEADIFPFSRKLHNVT
jgi:hypothetical protein